MNIYTQPQSAGEVGMPSNIPECPIPTPALLFQPKRWRPSLDNQGLGNPTLLHSSETVELSKPKWCWWVASKGPQPIPISPLPFLRPLNQSLSPRPQLCCLQAPLTLTPTQIWPAPAIPETPDPSLSSNQPTLWSL